MSGYCGGHGVAENDMPGVHIPAEEYLIFVRSLGCLLCGAPAEAAHVRYGAWQKYGKAHSGMGKKPHDMWTVPLCANHHRLTNESQHSRNEKEWWAEKGVDPLAFCVLIRSAYPDANAVLWAFPSTSGGA